jgi:SAM-dependent methyltransferase
MSVKNDAIRQQVRKRYAQVAKSSGSCCSSAGCCSPQPQASKRVGYSAAEIKAVPAGANMGLGCGNPQTIADLKPGEVVVDLGSGGGFDCFLAVRQIGKRGKVIGVDMTPDMISKARRNAEKGNYKNVEFRLGEIENLPVADNTANVIISNCVINLSPDKQRVFNEAYRILRKNGRLAISDVVALKPLPDKLKKDMDAYGGCIAGAAEVGTLKRMLSKAGFTRVVVQIKNESGEFIKDWHPEGNAANYVRSAAITAYK